MASMRDIKRRRESIQSTGQITKAMKLVSTVKLQKAKSAAENSKPFFKMMYDAVNSMLAHSLNVNHKYLKPSSEGSAKGVVVMSGNRGLAGGYNVNVAKLIINGNFSKDDTIIYNIGRKGKEILERKGFKVVEDYSEVINAPLYEDAMSICKQLLQDFEDGKIGEIYMAYTSFKNTVVHEPTLIRLLPVQLDGDSDKHENELFPMNYEPEEEDVLDLVIPKYITSLLYGALKESMASENGARMQAMDNATSNAEEMISDLELKYNRARQAAITQELTEIISGANAIS